MSLTFRALWRLRRRALVLALTVALPIVGLSSFGRGSASAEWYGPLSETLWTACNDGRSSVVLVLDAGSLDDAPWPGGVGVALSRAYSASVGAAISKVGLGGLIFGSDESPTRATKKFYIGSASGLYRACVGHGRIGPVYDDVWGPDFYEALGQWQTIRGIEHIGSTRWGSLYRIWNIGHAPPR